MATLHYHHSLVTKIFTSWKQWAHGCQEARSKEQMKQHQHHKMAALLARVTAVCQHDLSTTEKEYQPVCQHDLSTTEKECQPMCQHDPPIKNVSNSVKSSNVDKECHSVSHHNHSTLGEKLHNSPALKREDTTPGLITSKLVRQELVS